MLARRPAALVDGHWIDFALQHLDPTLSVTRTFARIAAIRRETPDMTTLLLAPNGRFRGFVPGQHVPVRVVLGGVVHERCYSPTSEPHDPRLAITVKRHPSGTVSRWVADVAAVGDVVELGPAAGDFVLPPTPTPFLFIAGGSGITAVSSLLRAALRARAAADAVLLYYARTPADFAFAGLLRDLAARHPRVRVEFLPQTGGGCAPAGRFSAAHLAAWAPDYAERTAFLCGPEGLMEAVARHWADAGLAHRLRREAFAPLGFAGGRTAGARASVSFRRSGRTVESAEPTLLAIAEAAGLRPPTGCRRGICRTCLCTKLSGTVRDRVTGAVDAAAGSRIRICVSEPLGPVTLDL